jgi:CTP synthase (UTP-ammonia lyase)
MKRITIALVGDFDEKIQTLVALNSSIEHVRPALAFELNAEWVPTDETDKVLSSYTQYQGIWIVPGSPYKNDEGVFAVIRKAREKNIPILGTCGGFQYMIIEYAKNVLKIKNAGHEEIDPAADLVISKLSCSLKGKQEIVEIRDTDSWPFDVLKTDRLVGHYFCGYGVNPSYHEILNHYPFVFTAFSSTGEVRAFELKEHRFFKGTLFQPSLDSSPEKPNPFVVSFFEACDKYAL